MIKSLKLKVALTILIFIAILVWLAILIIKGVNTNIVSWEAINEIPTAIGLLTPVGLWFIKWGWRWRIFKVWLVLVPDLNGTWKGELCFKQIDPITQKQESIKKDAFLVINQTLFDICCKQITDESESCSRATIMQSSFDGSFSLEFIYSNSPKVSVQDRSKPHDGACILKIIEKPNKKLIGKYWTERNTKGEMNFKFVSKKMRQEF